MALSTLNRRSSTVSGLSAARSSLTSSAIPAHSSSLSSSRSFSYFSSVSRSTPTSDKSPPSSSTSRTPSRAGNYSKASPPQTRSTSPSPFNRIPTCTRRCAQAKLVSRSKFPTTTPANSRAAPPQPSSSSSAAPTPPSQDKPSTPPPESPSSNPSPASSVGKMIPYGVLGFGELCLILTIMRVVFQVPIHGNVFALLGMSLPFLLTVLGVGLFISTKARTQAEAFQLSMARSCLRSSSPATSSHRHHAAILSRRQPLYPRNLLHSDPPRCHSARRRLHRRMAQRPGTRAHGMHHCPPRRTPVRQPARAVTPPLLPGYLRGSGANSETVRVDGDPGSG